MRADDDDDDDAEQCRVYVIRVGCICQRVADFSPIDSIVRCVRAKECVDIIYTYTSVRGFREREKESRLCVQEPNVVHGAFLCARARACGSSRYSESRGGCILRGRAAVLIAVADRRFLWWCAAERSSPILYIW